MSTQNLKDKRRHSRQKGFWSAIAIMPGRVPLNCVVRDLSDGGARLEFSEPLHYSTRFQLFIEAHDREYTCEVRHSGDYGVGVQFIHSQQIQHDLVRFGRRPQVPPLDAMTDASAADDGKKDG